MTDVDLRLSLPCHGPSVAHGSEPFRVESSQGTSRDNLGREKHYFLKLITELLYSKFAIKKCTVLHCDSGSSRVWLSGNTIRDPEGRWRKIWVCERGVISHSGEEKESVSTTTPWMIFLFFYLSFCNSSWASHVFLERKKNFFSSLSQICFVRSFMCQFWVSSLSIAFLLIVLDPLPPTRLETKEWTWNGCHLSLFFFFFQRDPHL